MILQFSQSVMVTIAIAGLLLNIKRRWEGFVLWLVSNGFWAWYNYKIDEYAQSLLFGVFFVSCLVGMLCWRKRYEWLKALRISDRQLRMVKTLNEFLETEKARLSKEIKDLTRRDPAAGDVVVPTVGDNDD